MNALLRAHTHIHRQKPHHSARVVYISPLNFNQGAKQKTKNSFILVSKLLTLTHTNTTYKIKLQHSRLSSCRLMLMVCLHFAAWARLVSSTCSTCSAWAQGSACHLTDLLTQSTGGQIMDHQLSLKDFVRMKLWPHMSHISKNPTLKVDRQKNHLSSQKPFAVCQNSEHSELWYVPVIVICNFTSFQFM